jgi:hypothetical protein
MVGPSTINPRPSTLQVHPWFFFVSAHIFLPSIFLSGLLCARPSTCKLQLSTPCRNGRVYPWFGLLCKPSNFPAISLPSAPTFNLQPSTFNNRAPYIVESHTQKQKIHATEI